jgi:TonB family protein
LTYPQEAKDKGIHGRITISFTVGTDGKVSNVKVLRGVNPLLDNEAKRVIEMSPAWTPGKMGGKPVPVTYTFPVIYKLN